MPRPLRPLSGLAATTFAAPSDVHPALVMPDEAPPPVAPDEPDFTVEQGFVVFTAAFHRRRGQCCGSGCRHCPFTPRHEKGSTSLAPAGPRPRD